MSVGTHKRYCRCSAPQDKEYKCTHCSFSPGRENGFKVHTPRENIQTHNVTLKEKEVFAWTEAQLEFLAKKTPKLNIVLAKLMDRGEQAIQKIRTKTVQTSRSASQTKNMRN